MRSHLLVISSFFFQVCTRDSPWNFPCHCVGAHTAIRYYNYSKYMICSYASYSVVSKSEFIVMIWWKCTENVRMSRTYNNTRSSPCVCRNFVAPNHGWKISAPPLDRGRWGRLIDYRVWSFISLPYQTLEISADPLGLLNIIIPWAWILNVP